MDPKTTRKNTKQSLYFLGDDLDEIKKESERLERSMSWVVQRAWKEALEEIRAMPTVKDP